MAKLKRIFATANDSKAIQILCQQAEQQELPVTTLWKILCVTNADPDLIAFPTNCANLIEMIELMGSEWGAHMQDSQSGIWLRELQTEWLPVLQWVVEQRSSLQALMPRPVFDPKPSQTPPKNPNANVGFARHPIHAMLWCSHPQKSLQTTYRLAQAHLFAAIVASFQSEYGSPEKVAQAISAYRYYGAAHEWQGLPNSPSKACLTVRHLCFDQLDYQTYLQRLPVSLPPHNFANSLTSFELPSGDIVKRRHREFRFFLEKAFGLRSVVVRRGIVRRVYPHSRHFQEPKEIGEGLIHRELDLGDKDDKYLDPTNPARISLCQKRSKEEIDKILNLDDDPWDEDVEAGEDEFYVTSEGDANSEKRRSVPTWSQQQPIQMANQLLPLSYQTMSQSEARAFLLFTEQWLQAHGSGRLSEEEINQLEVVAFLLLSLATGISINEDCCVKVYSAGTESPGAPICLQLPTQPGELAVWHIAVPDLPYLYHPEVQAKTQRQQGDEVILPDVLGVSRFFQRLRQAKHRQANAQAVASKARSWGISFRSSIYRHEILEKVDPQSRITRTKIAGYLFSRLMISTGGDITAAALVAGRKLPLARARLFYACTKLQRIQKCYVRAIGGLQPPEKPIDESNIRWDTGNTWIATRPCPTVKAVIDAVQLLSRRLGDLLPYSSLQDYIEYHNLYTLHTLWYCSFATSIRPISSPLFFPHEIQCDPDGDGDGIAWINDKNVGKGYTARLAWVPAGVVEQINYYARHLSAVRAEILFRHGDGARKYGVMLAKSCFFLDASMRPVEVRERSLETHMHRFLQYPANIHRRFVSAELLDRGVSPEAVDWWMGHWHLGEEPWGRYSSLSFAKYRAQLRPLLDLLSELAFRSKRSAVDPQGKVQQGR
jgi:hypothetical protein